MLDAAVYFPPAISFHEVSSRLFVLMADLSVTVFEILFYILPPTCDHI